GQVLAVAGPEGTRVVREASCRAHDDRHTAFEGTFSIPAEAGPLSVDLTLLAELPRGHRSYMRVTDGSGVAVARAMLRHDASALRLPGAAGSEAQGTADDPPRSGFFALGLQHILTGFDHLAFLVVLLLGASGFRSMLASVSWFTIAHSATLALGALGVVRIPASVVEPAIALTIVVAALRTLHPERGGAERGGVVVLCGLLHGLGFASCLRDLTPGGSAQDLVEPLLMFNLGVEAGQLLVAILVLPVLSKLRRLTPLRIRTWRLSGHHGASYIAASVGAFWLVDRLLQLL
ncbi:MAG: HupE/UreJ family protein, partial [Myxococcales bacterium]|nr:HupE/UreJ family protein [Myxococcales bacterium]